MRKASWHELMPCRLDEQQLNRTEKRLEALFLVFILGMKNIPVSCYHRWLRDFRTTLHDPITPLFPAPVHGMSNLKLQDFYVETTGKPLIID
jgi:hypothetical protein